MKGLRLPSLSAVHWASIALLLAIVAALAGLVVAGWARFGSIVEPASHDRWSLPMLLSVLTLLYLAVVVGRMVLEPQYANFVWGRMQEVIFLRSWHRAQTYATPLIAIGAVAVGYWQQGGWTVPSSALAWAAFLWAVMNFVKEVTGAWVRPVEKEDYLLLEPGSQAAIDDLPPQDAAIVPPPGTREFKLERTKRRIVVREADPGRPQWRLLHGFLVNDEVNRALQDDASTLCTRPLARQKQVFALTDEFERYREVALIHERSKGGTLFNEAKVRLRSDLHELLRSQEAVQVQKTSYYASICSNELTRYLIGPRNAAAGARTDLYQHVRHERSGEVIPLATSALSNHLGGGTLAITRDGYLLVSKQGRLALLSAGLYAPAGSGSFDWGDARHARTLAELVKAGLERELREECKFTREEVRRTIILGFGREMTRGGKPDFMGVSLVQAEAEPRIRIAEAGFIDQHHPIRLSATDAASLKAELVDIRQREYWHASGPLLTAMQLLIDAQPQTHEAILQFMRGASAVP